MGGLLRHEAYRGVQKGGRGPGNSRLAGELPSLGPVTATRLEHPLKGTDTCNRLRKPGPPGSTPAQLTRGSASQWGWLGAQMRGGSPGRGTGHRAQAPHGRRHTQRHGSGRQGVRRSRVPTGTCPPARPPGGHCAQTHVPGPRAPCDRWRLHQDLVWLFLSGGEKLLPKIQHPECRSPGSADGQSLQAGTGCRKAGRPHRGRCKGTQHTPHMPYREEWGGESPGRPGCAHSHRSHRGNKTEASGLLPFLYFTRQFVTRWKEKGDTSQSSGPYRVAAPTPTHGLCVTEAPRGRACPA